MCGIAGIFSQSQIASGDRQVLKRMADVMVHRGPDGEGFYFDAHVGLAHRRLSIIDLEGGKQPLSNEDGTVWVTFNGEIYNYLELREVLLQKGHKFTTSSDTEVIVHLYEEKGDEFLADLRGMFAIGLWDARKRRLLLARDRVGKKPLFYATLKQPHCLRFGAEIAAASPGSIQGYRAGGLWSTIFRCFTCRRQKVFTAKCVKCARRRTSFSIPKACASALTGIFILMRRRRRVKATGARSCFRFIKRRSACACAAMCLWEPF